MLSDKTIVKLTRAVSKQFGNDIGQQVALKLVIRRDAENIKDWQRLSFWLGWMHFNEEKKYASRLECVTGIVEEEELSTCADCLFQQVDARLTLKALYKTIAGRKLINHVLGKTTLGRQNFSYLQQVVRKEIEL